jgi:hypothetical protein
METITASSSGRPVRSESVEGLPELTDVQRALAETRARCSVAAADAQALAQPDGFVSVRDTRWAAGQVGTAAPDYSSEKHMVRAAGFGRFKTGALLGEWELLVNATYESARFHREQIDVDAVSRLTLAWCLADRPSAHPVAALALLARDIASDDVHNEQLRPSYRRLLDGWRRVLGAIS